MTDVTDALKNLKAKTASQEAPEEEAPSPEVEAPQDTYQQYTSSRVSTCLITPSGKRINFTNYEYYTKDPEIIDYLNTELEGNVRGIKIGLEVKAEDINPMAALKRKHIEEFLASQEGRDYTARSADPAKVAKKSAIMSSSGVAY